MASLHPPRFSSTTPHFFKIILNDTSKCKLKIPKKFVMKYGKDLSNSVCLKLPSDSEWEVGLMRCKGSIWFEKGWQDFSTFCSLQYGSFVLFRYEGSSNFGVFIFDTSATEIDYPISVPEIEEADDLSIEILEQFDSPKTRSKSPLPLPDLPPCKKIRTRLSGKTDMTEKTQSCDISEKTITNKESHHNKLVVKTNHLSNGESIFLTKRIGGCSSSSKKLLDQTHEFPGRMKSLTAIEKANTFNSDKPSFDIIVHPYSVHYDCVSLPNEFTRRYLMKLPAGLAILRVSDGRTWCVKFKYNNLNSRARLQGGWLSFVRENNLKVGDVCIFTLIDCMELLFEVVFFPTKNSATLPSSTDFGACHGVGAAIQVEEKIHPLLKIEPECSMDSKFGKYRQSKFSGQATQRPSSSLRTSRVNIEAASKFSSKSPFFKVTIGSGHSVHVPANFAMSFIKHGKQTAILQVKDRSWHVNLISYKPNATSISQGWAAFAKENCLKNGDICIFELMEMNDIVLRVHIFRC